MAGANQRRFVTCCARLSPEKRIMEYVQIVTAAKATLTSLGLVRHRTVLVAISDRLHCERFAHRVDLCVC